MQKLWKDGIFQSGSTFSKMFCFDDINYQIAGKDAQKAMFRNYSKVLNSLEPDHLAQITIRNHKRNMVEFEKDVLFPMQHDALDLYRKEYNQILSDHANEGNGIVQEKYLTITTTGEKDIQSVRNQFSRISTVLGGKMKELGSELSPVDAKERLQILHSFYRNGEEAKFQFDLKESMKLGRDFRDYICPDYAEKGKDYLKLGEKYCRVLFFKNFSTYISDTMIKEICDIDRDLFLTITVNPLSTEKANQIANRHTDNVNASISRWQQRQNRAMNFSAVMPYHLELQRQECREFLEDLRTRDQRVFYTTITLAHMADTLEELNTDTKNIQSIVQNKTCQLAPLMFQQLDGLLTTLPFGLYRIYADYAMTTDALSTFIPFNTRDVNHPHGVYYGQNLVSGNMLLVNRLLLKNGNCFILGTSGSGKSMTGKNDILSLRLNSDADVIVIDPDREYGRLIEEFGGELICLSEVSKNHINAMEFCQAHDETLENAINRKQSFVLSLCTEIMGGNVDSKARSLIDRCSGNIYRNYLQSGQKGNMPTLKELYEEIKAQPEELGKEIALEIELYAKGSLNTFAQQTNVDTQNRLICYDIHEMEDDLMTVGMLVVLDNIMNRISQNREDGKKTYIFIDEIYLLFRHQYTFKFLSQLWKRVRKYGGNCTGLTQNVEDVLQTKEARTLIANSELLVMLDQSPTDRPILADMLKIPESQLSYITGVKPGHGILKVGSALIPFANEFPEDTELYKLITTKQDEVFQQKQEKAAG